MNERKKENNEIEKKKKRLGLHPSRRQHRSRRAAVGPTQAFADLKKNYMFFRIFLQIL